MHDASQHASRAFCQQRRGSVLTKRTVAWWSAVAGGVVLVAGLAVGGVVPRESRGRTNVQANASATPLTLQQAWDLLSASAQHWRQDARLVQLTSSNAS